jgi:1-deoxy-D-xylulose-5-phosphate reductoisomerase
MKAISILGSTGSIGCNTLKVVEFLREPEFKVVALGAGKNVEKLAEQTIKFEPELVSLETEECAENFLQLISKSKIKLPKIEIGEKGLIAAATHERPTQLFRQLLARLVLCPPCERSKLVNAFVSQTKKRL